MASSWSSLAFHAHLPTFPRKLHHCDLSFERRALPSPRLRIYGQNLPYLIPVWIVNLPIVGQCDTTSNSSCTACFDSTQLHSPCLQDAVCCHLRSSPAPLAASQRRYQHHSAPSFQSLIPYLVRTADLSVNRHQDARGGRDPQFVHNLAYSPIFFQLYLDHSIFPALASEPRARSPEPRPPHLHPCRAIGAGASPCCRFYGATASVSRDRSCSLNALACNSAT